MVTVWLVCFEYFCCLNILPQDNGPNKNRLCSQLRSYQSTLNFFFKFKILKILKKLKFLKNLKNQNFLIFLKKFNLPSSSVIFRRLPSISVVFFEKLEFFEKFDIFEKFESSVIFRRLPSISVVFRRFPSSFIMMCQSQLKHGAILQAFQQTVTNQPTDRPTDTSHLLSCLRS